MQFIDLEEVLPLVREQLLRLREAQDAVTRAAPEDRAQLIREYRPRWVALRAALAEVSNGKCWYVECMNPGTDDDVDHFRPKLSVWEVDDHPGYYWLAFNWKNLRLSCHRANRPRRHPTSGQTGGKADHFPLLPGSTRAYGPGDRLDLEAPALLDPTNPADPLLLWFKANGEADLAPQRRGDANAEIKVTESLLWLHINWPEFVEQRRVVYQQVERLVNRGEEAVPAGPAAPVTERFVDVVRDLRRAMQPTSEYSAAARSYVEAFGFLWWVKDIVLKGAS